MRPPYGVPYVLQLMKRLEPCHYIIYSVVRPTVLVGNRRLSRNLLAVHDNFLDGSKLLGDGAPAVHGASEPNTGRSSLRDLGTFGFGDGVGNTLAVTDLLINLEEADRPAVADGEKEGSNILDTHV
jgi:hypothetical protein